MPVNVTAMVARQYRLLGDPITLCRPGEAAVTFQGIVKSVDAELLGGSFLSASHKLRFPTAAVQLEQGDQIEHASTAYRLLHSPRRIADGHESEAPLTELQV